MNRGKGGAGEEAAQARCQSHTSHVAVVDLPPPCLACSLPSIPRLSLPCQDVSGASRHGVSPLLETALPSSPDNTRAGRFHSSISGGTKTGQNFFNPLVGKKQLIVSDGNTFVSTYEGQCSSVTKAAWFLQI